MNAPVKSDLTHGKPFRDFVKGTYAIGPAGKLRLVDEPYASSVGDWYVKCEVLKSYSSMFSDGDEMSFRLPSIFTFNDKYGPRLLLPPDIKLSGLTGGFSCAIFLDFRVRSDNNTANDMRKWFLHVLYDHQNNSWSFLKPELWKEWFT